MRFFKGPIPSQPSAGRWTVDPFPVAPGALQPLKGWTTSCDPHSPSHRSLATQEAVLPASENTLLSTSDPSISGETAGGAQAQGSEKELVVLQPAPRARPPGSCPSAGGLTSEEASAPLPSSRLWDSRGVSPPGLSSCRPRLPALQPVTCPSSTLF